MRSLFLLLSLPIFAMVDYASLILDRKDRPSEFGNFIALTDISLSGETKNIQAAQDFVLKKIFGQSNLNPDLDHAVMSDNACKVKSALLAGADINQKDEHGNTPLHNAITFGSIQALKELLSYKNGKLNLEEYDKRGNTPLLETIDRTRGPNAMMADLMLKAGANPNAQEKKSGKTVLDVVNYYLTYPDFFHIGSGANAEVYSIETEEATGIKIKSDDILKFDTIIESFIRSKKPLNKDDVFKKLEIFGITDDKAEKAFNTIVKLQKEYNAYDPLPNPLYPLFEEEAIAELKKIKKMLEDKGARTTPSSSWWPFGK